MTAAKPTEAELKATSSKGTKPDRRRVRSRAALIRAAQQILSEDAQRNVSIQEITDLADIGFGTFYGHFETKAELFDAAVKDALEEHGALLEALAEGLQDPAEIYIVGIRMTGRLARVYPAMARVLVNTGMTYITSDEGLAPRALRDLRAAIAAGRFDVVNPELTQIAVSASVLGLLQYLDIHPEVDAGETTDELARSVVRMLGLTRRQAEGLVARPLPEPPEALDLRY